MNTEKILIYMKNPMRVFVKLGGWGFFNWMSDETYLKIAFRSLMGKKLNLKNPQTFNEKLQWLKLHDRKPIYTTMVDKYEAKKYVTGIIGEQYIIPTLGIWNKFEDIDFDKLPNQFVLKCTHDSGGLVICRDKSKFDVQAAKKKINRSLKRNYFWQGREWPYKDVKPRVIAEKYMEDNTLHELRDYKFFCFNGHADSVMVCIDRAKKDTKFYFFNQKWELQRLNIRGKQASANFTLEKPAGIDRMFKLAEVLAQNLAFARVDFYFCNGQIYFGEITFFPESGFDAKLLSETNTYWGRLIGLTLVGDKK